MICEKHPEAVTRFAPEAVLKAAHFCSFSDVPFFGRGTRQNDGGLAVALKIPTFGKSELACNLGLVPLARPRTGNAQPIVYLTF